MDLQHKECAMCKKRIDNTSNYITFFNETSSVSLSGESFNSGAIQKGDRRNCPNPYDKGHIFFHRFCYFNYRMMT